MQPDAAIAPKRRAVSLEAAALRVARAGRSCSQTAHVTVGTSIRIRWIITGRSRVAGPEVLKPDWVGEDAAGKLQFLLFEVCARRSRHARTKVPCCRSTFCKPHADLHPPSPAHGLNASPAMSSGASTARSVPQDDLLLDVQELARQRLNADERAVLAASLPEAAQRHLLDDTSYALQVMVALIGRVSGRGLTLRYDAVRPCHSRDRRQATPGWHRAC